MPGLDRDQRKAIAEQAKKLKDARQTDGKFEKGEAQRNRHNADNAKQGVKSERDQVAKEKQEAVVKAEHNRLSHKR